jgi:hypothetical protein
MESRGDGDWIRLLETLGRLLCRGVCGGGWWVVGNRGYERI